VLKQFCRTSWQQENENISESFKRFYLKKYISFSPIFSLKRYPLKASAWEARLARFNPVTWNNPIKPRFMSHFLRFCRSLPELYPSNTSSIWWAFSKTPKHPPSLPGPKLRCPDDTWKFQPWLPSGDWFRSSGSNPELQTPPTRTDRTGCPASALCCGVGRALAHPDRVSKGQL